MRGVGAGSLYPNVSVTNGGDANGLTVIPTEALTIPWSLSMADKLLLIPGQCYLM